MSTPASATTGAAAATGGGTGGVNDTPAAGTQEAVNAAESFDSAANAILDLGPHGEPTEKVAEAAPAEPGKTEPVAGNAGEQAAAATGAAAQPGDNKDQAGKPAVDEWAIDKAALDRALVDPAHGPLVKALHDQVTKLTGIRDHWGSIEEARDARALVPGGLEELKTVVETARSARAENAEFVSGDPARQGTALTALQAEAPEAFAAGLSPYIDIVAQKSPEAFQAALRPHLSRSLEASGLFQSFAKLQTAIAAEDSEANRTAVASAYNEFTGLLGKLGLKADGAAPAGKTETKQVDPELAKAQAELAKYKEADQQALVNNYKAWSEPANVKIQEGLRTDITEFIDKYIPKTIPTAVREGLLELTRNNIENEVLSQLMADTAHQQKLVDVAKAWKDKPEETVTQLINLQRGRARHIIAAVGAKHVSRYTETTVKNNQDRNAADLAKAGRADVTGGTPGRVKTPALTVKDMKGGGAGQQLTDEQILEM